MYSSDRDRKIALSGDEEDLKKARGFIQDIISTGSIPMGLLNPVVGEQATMEIPINKGILLFFNTRSQSV